MVVDKGHSIGNLAYDVPNLRSPKPGRLIVIGGYLRNSCMAFGMELAIYIFLQIEITKLHVNKVVSGVPEFAVTVKFNYILMRTST